MIFLVNEKRDGIPVSYIVVLISVNYTPLKNSIEFSEVGASNRR